MALRNTPDPLDELKGQQELETELELDRRQLEQADSKAPRSIVVAPGYIHAKHPDIDDELTFVPGERLPDWAADALRDGKGKPTADGYIVLEVTRAKEAAG